MRAPLNSTLRLTYTLSRARTHRQADGLGLIRSFSFHSLMLMSTSPNLSKIQAYGFKIHPIHFQWRAFLNGIMTHTQMQAIERAIRFQLEGFPNLLTGICADKNLLCQVLQVLCNKVKLVKKSQIALRVCSQCPYLGVLVEGLLLEKSKLIPSQCLCFKVSGISLGMIPAHLKENFQSLNLFGGAQSLSPELGIPKIGVRVAIARQWSKLTGSKLRVISGWGKGSTLGLKKFFLKGTVPKLPNVHLAQLFCALLAKNREVWFKLMRLGRVQTLLERATYLSQQSERCISFPGKIPNVSFLSKIKDLQRSLKKAIAVSVEECLYPERSL